MSNPYQSITALEVTAMYGELVIRIEMSKELKQKLEKKYSTDCAYKLLVGQVLEVVDYEYEVDGHTHELITPREA